MNAQLLHGNCLERLKELPDNSVDAVVTDPPYGLSFMGKKWDYDVPSEDIWRECLRVLKPGGHLLAFAGTRTQHRMAVRIEDAGFEIRDMIAWVYGSGFPKSLDVSKAIDKAAGRIGHATDSIKDILRKAHKGSGRTLAQLNEICGFEASGYLRDSSTWARVLPPQDKWPVIRDALDLHPELDSLFAEAEREVVGYQKRGNSVNTDFMRGGNDITAPATDAARQWQGWGTALKPALEPITVARKPLVGTVAENVLEHGTGAINVDGCRVATPDGKPAWHYPNGPGGNVAQEIFSGLNSIRTEYTAPTSGRWPANLIHDGSEEVVGLFPVTTSGKPCGIRKANHHWDSGEQGTMLTGFGDTGSAARFFYCAKASKRDRDEGLTNAPEPFVQFQTGNGASGKPSSLSEGRNTEYRNNHPTVKPTALMRYLCRLVTPPGGTVLDPFMGSGSTGKAAMLEGFQFIGIEREAEYLEIAKARIEHAAKSVDPQLDMPGMV